MADGMIDKPETDMNNWSQPHVDKWTKHAFNSRGPNQWAIKPEPLMMI